MGTISTYKKELQRHAWRLQYQVRRKHRRECHFLEESHPIHSSMECVIDLIYVEQILDEIPSNIGKKIIHDLFIQDKTESQLARELSISQQAVNKWKRKMIHLLSQKLSL